MKEHDEKKNTEMVIKNKGSLYTLMPLLLKRLKQQRFESENNKPWT